MPVFNNFKKSNIAINGIIEKYYVNAGATVSAGDFVEFVSKFGNGQFTDYAIRDIAARKIDNNRVLVAFSTSNAGFACVIKIGESGVSVGNILNCSKDYTLEYASIVLFTESYALIAAIRGGQLFSYCVNINDINLSYYGGYIQETISKSSITAIKISEDKALITYRNKTGVAMACLLSNTGSRLNTVTIANGVGSISAASISSDKVLVSYASAGGTGYATVLTVSGNNITVGSSSQIDPSNTLNSQITNPVMLTENKGVMLCYEETSGRTMANTFTVENTTVTFSESLTVVIDDKENYPTPFIEVVALSENKVLVTHRDNENSGYGTAVLLTIDGASITVGESVVFDYNATDYHALVSFSPVSALVLYNNGVGSYATINVDGDTITSTGAMQGMYIQPATSRMHNVGVAKTGGSEGKLVEVFCVKKS